MTSVRCVTVSGARKWKTRVGQGLPLQYDAVEQMPATGCVEYLRAMGETVSRIAASDTDQLRQLLKRALGVRHGVGPGGTWTPDTGATRLGKQQQKEQQQQQKKKQKKEKKQKDTLV